MAKIITLKKEEVDRMMKIKGNVRGATLKGHFDYIRDLKGEKGVKAVKHRLEELGYPLKTKEIGTLKWYPETLGTLIIIVCVEVFKWKKKDVFEMAYQAPKYSFIVKLLMRHFLGIKKTFYGIPKYWWEYFDFSEMEVLAFNEKEQYGVIGLKNFHKYHPLLCLYHRAYLLRVAEIMVKVKKVKIEHTKCLFRNDPYEEFKISWA